MYQKIYFDYAAAEPLLPEVKEYLELNAQFFYNPSAYYQSAKYNRILIEDTRSLIAERIGCEPEEIIFTSGCSESNALAVDGWLKANPQGRAICSGMEHASIFDNPNVSVELNVDKFGCLDLDGLKKTAAKSDPHKLLVCVTHGNNEVGTIQDLKGVREAIGNAVLLVDAAQTFGKLDINVKEMGIDMLSCSAGKIGGLRGTGFLYVSKSLSIKPLIYGTQEQGMRGGTYFDLGIGAFNKALKHLKSSAAISTAVKAKRNWLISKLLDIPDVCMVGKITDRLPNNICIRIRNINLDSQQLVGLLDEYGFMVSSGSACHAYESELSHVLKAMGYTSEDARCCIRITIGEDTSVADLQLFLKTLEIIIKLHKTRTVYGE